MAAGCRWTEWASLPQRVRQPRDLGHHLLPHLRPALVRPPTAGPAAGLSTHSPGDRRCLSRFPLAEWRRGEGTGEAVGRGQRGEGEGEEEGEGGGEGERERRKGARGLG